MNPQVSIESPPQAETWTPQDPRLQAAVPVLEAAGLASKPYGFGSLDSVGALEIERTNGVAFVAATPHVDRDFDPWFVMLTVKAPEGTQLHTSKKRSTQNLDTLKSDLSVPLAVGEMIVFHAHKLHWVDRPEALKDFESEASGPYWSHYIATEFRDEMCIMVGTECRKRPSREQAEALLADYLAKNTPKIWATVKDIQPVLARRGPKR